MGHVPGALRRRVARHRALVDHAAAADRIGDAAVEQLRRPRRRRRSACRSNDGAAARAGGSAGRRLVEGDLVRAAEAEAAAPADPGDRHGRPRRGRSGRAARPTGRAGSRAVGGVALAGQSERAVEVDADLRRASQQPVSRRPSTKRQAAVIGPIVCELDGPTPILKRSKALQTKLSLPWRRHGPKGRPWQG